VLGEWAHAFSQPAGVRTADPMTSEENRRPPASTEVSGTGTKVELQLSACAQEGPGPPGIGPAGGSPGTSRLSVGELLGERYRIERELGEGGMGVVYLATDQQVPGERFAVKVMKEELHPDALELLREEVRKTRKLSHPNIVDVHSVNVDGRRLYVLMEYLEGKSLDVLLDEEFGRGMSFSHAWPIIEDVAAALANAHDHNVIHSDLKPANVFLTTSGRARLLDFGIARVSRGPVLKARSGLRALTPAYASCEMLEGKEADRRDDIYSFACVIYEMLCGERPFGDLTALQARESRNQVLPLAALSQGQNAALAQALAFDREARTGSVEALLAGLSAEHPPPPVRRAAGPLLAGIVMAVVAAGLTYLALDRFWIARQTQIIVSNEGAVAPATIPQKSIAVLPFVNISGDKEQEYFSDGLTEEMINLLGQVPDLRVPARTSSFYFKGKNETIANIARQLKVAHVLEGSVRKAGTRLRITAQLIRADNGYHVWSQAYDRDDTDIFAVQDGIAEAVVSALQLKLGAPVPETGSRATRSAEAYSQYLRGSQLDQRDSLESLRGAVEAYSRAAELDPNYAAAYAGRAIAEATLGDLTGDARGIERAGQDADRAIALAPADAIGYSARSYLRTVWLWDWSHAQADAEKALALGPRTRPVLGRYARLLAVLGRLPEAIAVQKEAADVDPLSSGAWDNLGLYYASVGDYAAASTALDRALEFEPKSTIAFSYLGMVRLLEGKDQEALEAFRKIDQEGFRLAGIAMAEHGLGHAQESQRALEELMAKHAHEQAYQIAEACAWRGEKDQALDWLERAYRQRDGGVSFIKFAPMLKPLRGDARFRALLLKLRLPE
jgi:TolB-like protein/Tfp pilus assembly protein PilF/predicted Ser/Thr protein kinase